MIPFFLHLLRVNDAYMEDVSWDRNQTLTLHLSVWSTERL